MGRNRGTVTSGQTTPRILLQLPNWLGDVVMSTPLLDYLAAGFAEVPVPERPQLHLAVRRAWEPLFRHDSRVAGILTVERGGAHAGVPGLWRLSRQMKAGRFDAIVIGPPSFRSGLTAFLAGIPLRVGHVGDARGGLLKPGVLRGRRGDRHFAWEMLDMGLALLPELGLATPALNDGDLPRPSLTGCQELAPVDLPETSPPLWLVAPGTTYGQAKTWPAERVTEFMTLAVNRHGVRIVLLGDRQAGEFVRGLREGSALTWTSSLAADGQVVDLTGQTDLAQVVGVMKSARAFVGNDSGLMHLAGALGLPTVGVFGSSNPDWTHPLGPWTAAVVAGDFACRPCYRRTCNQPEFCLATVGAGVVLERLQELLARAERDPGRT